MNNKLRLLITKYCTHHCEGCCNNDWDLNNLPIVTSFKDFDEILITGGEPIIRWKRVIDIIKKIREENKSVKIYMYCALIYHNALFNKLFPLLDGITLTLHTQEDKEILFQEIPYFKDIKKSLRLNVFKGVDISDLDLSNWKIKENIKWIKNCPLPQDEVFMRLKDIS